jgi:fatty acid amide hydrolase
MEVFKDTVKSWYDLIYSNHSLILRVIGGIITIYGVKFLLSFLNKRRIEKKWLAVAEKTRKERDSKVSDFYVKYSKEIKKERIIEIISLDLINLAVKIKKREITSYEAVLAYCLRASSVGKELNLITFTYFEEALTQSFKADEEIETHIKSGKSIESLPALIGVPVSIKDHITVKGIPNTIGSAALVNNKRDYNSLIVEVIINHGAIPFVSSNIPQGIFNIDSSNSLWGKAQNPWNRSKVVGGSSGGEAGLVASFSSPFGVGSDIGGSIRIPSTFCGVYGFKPSSTRVSRKGVMTPNGTEFIGFSVINVSLGPICRTIDDLKLTTSLLLGSFKDDFYCDNTAFDHTIANEKSKLKIGYLKHLPYANTCEDVLAKLEYTIDSLKVNHEVEEFRYEKLFDLNKRFFNILFNGGIIEELTKAGKGERLEEYNKVFIILQSCPQWILRMLSSFLKLTGESILSEDLKNFRTLERKEYLDAIRDLNQARSEFFAYFKSNNFDAILCPAWPSPSFDLGRAPDNLAFSGFMSLFNILDMPSGTVPVGLCSLNSYDKINNQHHQRVMEETMKGGKDLPIALMVSTLPKQDEKCLRLMKEVDDLNKFSSKFSKEVMLRPGIGINS